MWPRPCSSSTRHERATAADDAHQVDVQRPAPVVERGLRQRAGRGDSGIVDDDVDTVPGGENFIAHLLNRGIVADINLQCHSADAEFGDQPDSVLGAIHADISAGNAPAVLGEAERQRPAKAAAGSGMSTRF